MLEHQFVTAVFAGVVLLLLLLDLFVVGRNPHKISMKEAGIWTTIFVAVAIGFGFLVVGPELGPQAQAEYFTAYVIEKMLSVDNLFVFILVFSFFKVPKEYHHKVLFWGVLGAIIMRLIFIGLGVQFINLFTFTWAGYDINVILLLFGAFLLYTGIKTLFSGEEEEEEQDFNNSFGAKLIKKLFPRITPNYVGDAFFVRASPHTLDNKVTERGNFKVYWYATPLLVVVGVIEFTDLLFAVDSIPAIFAVSKDPYILYTSNIFAILGLRSMYFLLAGLLPRFKYLSVGVSLILAYIGTKMVIAPWYHIESAISLTIILAVLVISVIVSLIMTRKNV